MKLLQDREWYKYPVGTKVYSCTGGHWTKNKHGWQWNNGSTFPRPGADAVGRCVELPDSDKQK